MDGHEMKVAISNPPARRPPVTSGPVTGAAQQQQNQGSVRSLGGTSKQVIERLVSYIYVYVCSSLLLLSCIYTLQCQSSPSHDDKRKWEQYSKQLIMQVIFVTAIVWITSKIESNMSRNGRNKAV